MQTMETGNYYYGARYYDPKISVWLSVDPLAHKYPGFSPYVFTGNNPIMLVDPDGKKVYAGNQAAKSLLETSITRLFGENSGFSMGPKGYVAFDRRQFRQARKEWDKDQRKLARDFKRVVQTGKYEARVFVGEKQGETFSDKVQAPSVSWTDSEGRNVTQVPSPFVIEDQKISRGAVAVFKDEDYKSYGWVLVNKEELANLPYDVLQDEGVTEMGGTEILFHELLDHFLPYMKSGNLHPKTKTKKEEVDSYNRAARILGTEERTGARH